MTTTHITGNNFGSSETEPTVQVSNVQCTDCAVTSDTTIFCEVCPEGVPRTLYELTVTVDTLVSAPFIFLYKGIILLTKFFI